MNKTAIKNFAIWARNKLRADIILKAGLLGITDKGIAEPLKQSTDDLQIFDIGTSQPVRVEGRTAIEQRKSLVAAIKAKQLKHAEAFDAVIEEVAYTWFNRLIAVRFMEVNDYLPGRVRVLSSENPAKAEPDFVTNPFDTDLDFTEDEINLIDNLKDNNKSDELFQFLFIKQCNKLNEILPELFEKTNDYTELLLNVSFTDKDGVVYHLVHDIKEDDFNIEKEGQVEIIGWLYQYYNTEPKDKVFGRPSGQKIRKEDVPAATQLFTPDWIVRYMVENSLGRIAIHNLKYGDWNDTERAKIDTFKSKWKYYLEEAEQSQEIIDRFRIEERNKYKGDDPPYVNSTFLDPCMGSGHILVYAFDVFMDIYTAQGYTERDAAQRIVEKNLYGLELDDRATQLAYFAVMMKARSYDRRFLTRGIRPNLCSIQESNCLNTDYLELFGDLKPTAQKLVDEFIDAKEYGSILNLSISADEIAQLENKYAEIDNTVYDNIFDTIRQVGLRTAFVPLIKQAKIMVKKYDVVCTNPPYMGGGGMSPKLSGYVKFDYPYSKSDLSTVFMEKTMKLCVNNGYMAMINIPVWMFVSTYEKLRSFYIEEYYFVNMLHLGRGIFGADFGTTSFVVRKNSYLDFNGTFLRLFDKTVSVDKIETKEKWFFERKNQYLSLKSKFNIIAGKPIAYWTSSAFLKPFHGQCLGDVVEMVEGVHTRANDLFLRLWYEIDYSRSALENYDERKKWFGYNKGGDFRQWYGNNDYVVDWDRDGYNIKHFKKASIGKCNHFFEEGITYTFLTSSTNSFRYSKEGNLYDFAGPTMYPNNKADIYYLLGLFVSKICRYYLQVINPTINMPIGDVKKLPVIFENQEKVKRISEECVRLSQRDWDYFETSWDFQTHPLVQNCHGVKNADGAEQAYIEDAYNEWESECNERFNKLKANEEELNRIFIDTYGLQDELTPEVEEKDVTVRKADLQRDIKSFISYAVGCMFGRYSLDKEGLIFAGGEFSGQWVVVSGQYYLRKVVEELVIDELQRVNSMAEIYEFSYGDLSAGETSSERGNICSVRPDETSSSFNSLEHCRGTSTKLYEGIRELSFNSERIESRAGNPTYDLCSPEILNAISNGNGNELVQRGWKDAEYIDWKTIHYTLITNHYSPDYDNCIPITDTKYFDDDIVGRFCEFVKVVFGKDTLEANLDFIAKALGNKGVTSRDVIRNYFLNDFFKDHCKTYQKRPIYWLFDSGKQNGFKALCYMHRWNADTIGNMRVEYLHRIQRTYEKEIEREQDTIDNTTNSRDKSAAIKRKEKLLKQLKEAKDYDAKVAHLALSRPDIDLDDGVKVNYEKVQTAQDGKKLQILAKI